MVVNLNNYENRLVKLASNYGINIDKNKSANNDTILKQLEEKAKSDPELKKELACLQNSLQQSSSFINQLTGSFSKPAPKNIASKTTGNADLIRNAFAFNKEDKTSNVSNLSKTLYQTFDIPSEQESGKEIKGQGAYGTGRVDGYEAKYGDNGRIESIKTFNNETGKQIGENTYIYNDDGTFTEVHKDLVTDIVEETTYNSDGTIKNYGSYTSQDNYEDGNAYSTREYTYGIDEKGNPYQEMKNNFGITEVTTKNADGTYTTVNSRVEEQKRKAAEAAKQAAQDAAQAQAQAEAANKAKYARYEQMGKQAAQAMQANQTTPGIGPEGLVLKDGLKITKNGDEMTVFDKNGDKADGATVDFDNKTGNFTIITGGHGENDIKTTYNKDGKIVTKEFSSTEGIKIVLHGDKNGELSSIENASFISKDGKETTGLTDVSYDPDNESISFSKDGDLYSYKNNYLAKLFNEDSMSNGEVKNIQLPDGLSVAGISLVDSLDEGFTLIQDDPRGGIGTQIGKAFRNNETGEITAKMHNSTITYAPTGEGYVKTKEEFFDDAGNLTKEQTYLNDRYHTIVKTGDKTTVNNVYGQEIEDASVEFDNETGGFTIRKGAPGKEVIINYTKDGNVDTKEFSGENGVKISIKGSGFDKDYGVDKASENAVFTLGDKEYNITISNEGFWWSNENLRFSNDGTDYAYSSEINTIFKLFNKDCMSGNDSLNHINLSDGMFIVGYTEVSSFSDDNGFPVCNEDKTQIGKAFRNDETGEITVELYNSTITYSQKGEDLVKTKAEFFDDAGNVTKEQTFLNDRYHTIVKNGDKMTVCHNDGQEIKGASVEIDEETGNITISKGERGKEVIINFNSDGHVLSKEISMKNGGKILLQGSYDENYSVDHLSENAVLKSGDKEHDIKLSGFWWFNENVRFSNAGADYAYNSEFDTIFKLFNKDCLSGDDSKDNIQLNDGLYIVGHMPVSSLSDDKGWPVLSAPYKEVGTAFKNEETGEITVKMNDGSTRLYDQNFKLIG